MLGESWIDVDGCRTHYFDAGAGPVLVFLHGGTIGEASAAANAQDWAATFEPLVDAGYRCIAVDKLGQGSTDNPRSKGDWSMRGQVKHAIAFLEALGAGPYHVIGHSRGGYVACRVTLDAPHLVHSVVIVDSNTAAPGVGRNEIVLAEASNPPGSREAIVYQHEADSFRADHMPDAWIEQKQSIIATEKHQAAVTAMRVTGLYETVFQPSLRDDREDMFAKLEHGGLVRPTLLMWGYNDPTAPVELGYRLFALLSKHQARTQFHILNEAGHYSFRERAPEFNRVIDEFVSGVVADA